VKSILAAHCHQFFGDFGLYGQNLRGTFRRNTLGEEENEPVFEPVGDRYSRYRCGCRMFKFPPKADIAARPRAIPVTARGLSLTGAAVDVSEDASQSSCVDPVATIGQARVRPASVVRGMTSCDLFHLKGRANSIRKSDVNFGSNDSGVAKNMVLTNLENGVETRYVFIDNLLDRVE